MPTGGEIDFCLSLTRPEMEMLFIRRNHLSGCQRFVDVDEEVMMSGVGGPNTGRRYTHVA